MCPHAGLLEEATPVPSHDHVSEHMLKHILLYAHGPTHAQTHVQAHVGTQVNWREKANEVVGNDHAHPPMPELLLDPEDNAAHVEVYFWPSFFSLRFFEFGGPAALALTLV